MYVGIRTEHFAENVRCSHMYRHQKHRQKLIVGIHRAAVKGSCLYKNAEAGAPSHTFYYKPTAFIPICTSKVVNMQSKFYFIIARVQ